MLQSESNAKLIPQESSKGPEWTFYNKNWIVFPFISLLFFISSFIHLLFAFYQNGGINSTVFSIFLVSCLILLLIPYLVTPVFHFYEFVTNFIVTFYIGANVSCASIALLLAILTVLVIPILFLGIMLFYFWCMRDKIRLAGLTMKVAFKKLRESFDHIMNKLHRPMLFFFSFYAVTVLMLSCKAYIYSRAMRRTSEGLMIAFITLDSVSLMILESLLEATMFMFGAAFVFHSLDRRRLRGSVDEVEETETDRVRVRDAGEDADNWQGKAAVAAAFERVFKYSLGSCCMAAVLLFFIKFIDNLAENMKNRRDNKLGSYLTGQLLRVVATFFLFYTHQAMIYVPIYGKSLGKSGEMVLNSFKHVGIEKFLNFNFTTKMINLISFMLALMLGGIMLVIALLFRGYPNDSEINLVVYVSSILAVVITFLITSFIVSSLAGGASQAVLGVYVEDPERLKGGVEEETFEKMVKLVNKKII